MHVYRINDIPLRRIGSPQDAGRTILAVVSPLFSYVTGQVGLPNNLVKVVSNSNIDDYGTNAPPQHSTVSC